MGFWQVLRCFVFLVGELSDFDFDFSYWAFILGVDTAHIVDILVVCIAEGHVRGASFVFRVRSDCIFE